MEYKEVQENIQRLLREIGFSPADIAITHDEKNNTIWFSINSSDARFLLGRGAEALSALNYIASKIVERTQENNTGPRVIIDANDVEKKKIENIRTIAHMMAERARYFKSRIEVDPMSPRDRRIVHEALSDALDIQTESVGEGKNRRVVIIYTGKDL